MRRENCDRCGQPTGGTTTMSMFNTQVICMPCKKKEQEHTDYEAACKAEKQAIDKGDRYFKGKGLPKDLLPEDL